MLGAIGGALGGSMGGSMSGMLSAAGNISSLYDSVSNTSKFTQASKIDFTQDYDDVLQQFKDIFGDFGMEMPAIMEEPDEFYAALNDLSTKENTLNQTTELKSDSKKAEIEEAKTQYFLDNHYEWPMKDGEPDYTQEPKVVSGGEDAQQALYRQKYERLETEKVKQANIDASGEVDEKTQPATYKLQELMKDSSALQELMNKDGGLDEYNELQTQASQEAQDAQVKLDASVLKAGLPKELQGMADEYQDEILGSLDSNREILNNSDEMAIVKEYQSAVSEFTSKLREQMKEKMAEDPNFTGLGYDFTFD